MFMRTMTFHGLDWIGGALCSRCEKAFVEGEQMNLHCLPNTDIYLPVCDTCSAEIESRRSFWQRLRRHQRNSKSRTSHHDDFGFHIGQIRP